MEHLLECKVATLLWTPGFQT